MPWRVWIAALLALGLTWLHPNLRQGPLAHPGLHLLLALSGGVGALALQHFQPEVRRNGVLVFFLAFWALTIVALYVGRSPTPASFSAALFTGLALVLIPSLAATICARGQMGPGWTLVQVASLAIAAAPLSTLVMLVMSLLVSGEGP